MKILVADAISQKGVDALRANPKFQVDINTGLKEEQLLPDRRRLRRADRPQPDES